MALGTPASNSGIDVESPAGCTTFPQKDRILESINACDLPEAQHHHAEQLEAELPAPNKLGRASSLPAYR